MYTTQSPEYDVVIMGAGLAGVCQARHLLLNIPNIKIALVDPRPEERNPVKDLKIGESTVEVAALFLSKELGLYDYLVENQVPKIGLNFHWPKTPGKTQTLEDYYHIWTNRQPPIASFQINRSQLERDLLKMNQEQGATFINGRAIDVDLTEGDALNVVKVRVKGEIQELKAKHVVDAAGRNFIIGRKTDNLLFGPENLMGLNNGSAWMRVKHVDRTLFHDGYDPFGASSSHYYATNHYFGHGHWLWMIPIDTQEMELSIGVMHHHELLPADQLNTQEKFLSFLKANHTILHNLIKSGEEVDFNYWSRVAHKSKTMFSPDNWYVLGDAACIFDAFYSLGSTMMAFAVESVTEIVRAKLAEEANAEQKRSAYNEFNLGYVNLVNTLYQEHPKQLGHASIMSWRIYFEYIWWFGVIVPLFIGKWHLDLEFIPTFVKSLTGLNRLFTDLYQQFNELVERDANLGLMDCYRADQLIFGYYTPKHFDDFLENAKLEPLHCNIFASLKNANFYAAVWFVIFQWKGFGIKGLLKPKNLANFGLLIGLVIQAVVGEFIYKYKTRGLSDNSQVEQMRQEFKTYHYHPELQPSIAEVAMNENDSSQTKYPNTEVLPVLELSAVE